MHCRNCGAAVAEGTAICPSCGQPPLAGNKFCPNCGAVSEGNTGFCTQCGTPLNAAGTTAPPLTAAPPVAPSVPPGPVGAVPVNPEQKSKLAGALLGIFVGWLGIHRFYLGYNTIGIIQLVLGVLGFLTCGVTTLVAAIWGLVEGILILTGSINRDALGQPLRD
jgi:TM2 domain-containing membrane protein YozV/RNA polymerase subunit RPABC4/transcription elongation factor Spt4